MATVLTTPQGPGATFGWAWGDQTCYCSGWSGGLPVTGPGRQQGHTAWQNYLPVFAVGFKTRARRQGGIPAEAATTKRKFNFSWWKFALPAAGLSIKTAVPACSAGLESYRGESLEGIGTCPVPRPAVYAWIWRCSANPDHMGRPCGSLAAFLGFLLLSAISGRVLAAGKQLPPGSPPTKGKGTAFEWTVFKNLPRPFFAATHPALLGACATIVRWHCWPNWITPRVGRARAGLQ